MRRSARAVGWGLRLGQIGLLALGLGGIEYSVRRGLIGDLYAAAPTQIAQALGELLAGHVLWRHLAVTLSEYAIGFMAACLLGIGFGILLARVKSVETFAGPYLSGLMAVPKVVIVPLLTIWLGIGLLSKAVLVFLFSFFPVLYSTVAGVKQTGENHLKVARVFGASRLQTLVKVILPSAIPTMLAGLRVAAPAGLLGALFGEMLASKQGLGNVLTKAAQLYNTGQLFAVILLTTGLSVLLIQGIDLLEGRVFLRWRREAGESRRKAGAQERRRRAPGARDGASWGALPTEGKAARPGVLHME